MAIGTIASSISGNIRNIGGKKKPLIILNNRDITFSPNNNSGLNYVSSAFNLFYNSGVSGGGYASRYFTQTGTIDFKKYTRLQIQGNYYSLVPRNGTYGYIQILNANGSLYREIWNSQSTGGTINVDLDISTWTFEGKIRFQNYNWCNSSGSDTGQGQFRFSKFECNHVKS